MTGLACVFGFKNHDKRSLCWVVPNKHFVTILFSLRSQMAKLTRPRMCAKMGYAFVFIPRAACYAFAQGYKDLTPLGSFLFRSCTMKIPSVLEIGELVGLHLLPIENSAYLPIPMGLGVGGTILTPEGSNIYSRWSNHRL